jgi:AraC-like DNA-binding protein
MKLPVSGACRENGQPLHERDMADKERDTMEPLYWQKKFDASFTLIDSSGGFDRYHLENESGDGTITACAVFPGLQALYLDLRMYRCDNPLTLNKDVIEIGYCLGGNFECNVSKRYCYFVSAGDFSVGYAGKKESHGTFPAGQYQGINIFLDEKLFRQRLAETLRELDIRMEQIHALADLTFRCFLLRRSPELATIERAIADGFKAKSIPRLRVKVMELLLFLSGLDETAINDSPPYLNRNRADIAESVHKRLTADSAGHVTIDQLAAELGVGTTALKTSFKSVYGLPIYQFQKDLRLQKAQRLLRETILPISAVAAEAGYANPAKFSSAFKKRFDVSPTEYRRNAERED